MVSTLFWHTEALSLFRTDHHRMKLSVQFSRLALLFALVVPAWAAEPAARPNIVFIISDDQAWSDYGFMGHPQICAPRFDNPAAKSLTFHLGNTPVPVCRPSPATMTTGSKLSAYEGGVRTPIMTTRSGKIEPRMEKIHLASSIIFWPTLAALLATRTPGRDYENH